MTPSIALSTGLAWGSVAKVTAAAIKLRCTINTSTHKSADRFTAQPINVPNYGNALSMRALRLYHHAEPAIAV